MKTYENHATWLIPISPMLVSPHENIYDHPTDNEVGPPEVGPRLWMPPGKSPLKFA